MERCFGLYICWEYGRLRWYDPAVGYLRTHDEERSGRIAAEDRLEAAETHQAEERSGRIAAERRQPKRSGMRSAAGASPRRIGWRQPKRSGMRSAAGASPRRIGWMQPNQAEERSGRIAAEAKAQRLLEELARLRAAEDEA